MIMGISSGVLTISNFLFTKDLISHAEEMSMVIKYTNIILLNSNTSEVYGQKMIGVRKNKM